MRVSARLSSSALAVGVLMYGAYQLGSFLDRKFQSHPWASLGFVLLGAILGVSWIIYVATRESD